jgi:hypothetical protein
MNIADHHAALPAELRLTPEMVPEDIASAFAYALACDAMIDNDRVPVDQLPTYREWKAAHHDR